MKLEHLFLALKISLFIFRWLSLSYAKLFNMIKLFVLTRHLQTKHDEKTEENRDVLPQSGSMFLQNLEEHHVEQGTRRQSLCEDIKTNVSLSRAPCTI